MNSAEYRAVKRALDRFALAAEPTDVLARDFLGTVAQFASSRLEMPITFGIGIAHLVRQPEIKRKG